MPFERMKPFQLFIRQCYAWFFAAAAVEAMLCLVWLFLIPSDEKNAVIGGYSAARIGMGGLMLLAAVGSGAAAWLSWKHTAMTRWIADRVGSRWAAWTAALLLTAGVLGMGLLLTPAERLGESRYAFARLKPLITWTVLVCLQSGLVLTGLAAFHHRAFFSSLYVDARRSLAELPGLRPVAVAVLAGSVIGSLAALALSRPANLIFDQLPWLPGAGLLLGLLIILLGLLYTPSWLRLIPVALLILVLLSTATNAWTAPAAAEQARARIAYIADNSAPALGNQFHYSLSVYHTLSILFPGSEIVAAPELLAEWSLVEDRLRAWVPVTQVRPNSRSANLEKAQAEAILRQNPIEVEINTLEGTRYYYFLSSPSPGPVRLILAQYEKQRFFVPEEAYKRLVEAQGEQP